HLVREPQSAPFLLQVEHNAASGVGQLRHCKLELRSAVAPARSEYIAGEAGRMPPYIDRFRKIRFAEDDGDGARPDCIAEYAEPSSGAIRQRDSGLAHDLQRIEDLV